MLGCRTVLAPVKAVLLAQARIRAALTGAARDAVLEGPGRGTPFLCCRRTGKEGGVGAAAMMPRKW